MFRLRIIYLLVFLIVSLQGNSQDKHIFDLLRKDSKSADLLFARKEYSRAREYYSRLVKKDSSNPMYILRLAECNMYLNNTTESEKWYKKVIHDTTVVEPIHELHYAEVLMSNGKRDSARVWFERYNRYSVQDTRSKRMVEQVRRINQLFKDSLSFFVNPAANVNSPNSDFGAVYFNKGIVFVSSRKNPATIVRNINSSDNTYFLDLYYSQQIEDTAFSEPVQFHDDLSTSLHEGPVTFFDKERKVIFSRNLKAGEKDGVKRLGLFYGELSKKKKNQWVNIKPLPFCSKDYNVTHPYFHQSTNTLYFVSDMPGGYGGSDIYKAVYSGGQWTGPVNMGSAINTDKNEVFPFVSSDGAFLYFSSNGHSGLGGLDIFRADLNSKPVRVLNMGYPVNSEKDDFSFILDEKGNDGFFSSNRKNGGLDDDIYTVRLNRIKVEGIVLDRLKSVNIKDAQITLINQETGETEQMMTSNQKGLFTFYIFPAKKYTLEIEVNGYRSETMEIYTSNPDQKVMRVKGEMEKYNKAYVKGKVVLNGEGIGGARVQIFDPTADTVEVLRANARGEFQCQINTDTVNIVVADSKGKLGIYLTKSFKRTRKSSAIQFIEVPLGSLDSTVVKGVYNSCSPSASELLLKNELTNKEQPLYLNPKGEFTLKLWDICKYSIYVIQNNEKVLLYRFEPYKTKFIELSN